jgi:hypothetical protein
MRRWWSRMALLVAAVVIAGASVGCSSKSVATGTAAVTGASSLWNSLGGSTGVTGLANAFGQKISINPAITKFLDTASIQGVQNGLINSIAAAAGQSMPAGTTDLLGALQGKGLDAAAVKGLGDGLTAAAKDQKLSGEQIAALGTLMAPVSKALLAGQ